MRISFTHVLAASALLAATISCGKGEPKLKVEQASTPAAATAPAAATSATQAAPEAAPAAANAMASGHAAAQPQMPGLSSVSGTVAETMDSGGYTYMKLKLAEGGDTWAAVNQSKVKKGDKVTVVNAMQMDGFESKTLNRKFDHILFGQLGGGAAPAAMPAAGAPAGMPGAPNAAQSAQMAQQHAGLSSAPDPGKIDVPKADGADAKRIAEVFAQKAQLDGKSVTIRGKVVKFTPGVMGRNWMHLRDGSGNAEAKDNDITVTSKDGVAAIGDVVVVKGKVGVGRDFGMGYSYPVLIEEASVGK